MNATAIKLVAECKARGISLRPGERGKLKVSPPPERLPAELREALRHHKAEVLTLLSQPTPWPCPHCGRPAEIEDVCSSLDGTRTLTLWHCEPCQTWGVTPDTLRQPPVWVSRREQ
jgi:hypothetical protein